MIRNVVSKDMGGRNNRKNANAQAYLTVFLSLTLTIILSLFFTLIYGTRVNAVRMQAEMVMDTATASCLGEFSRELLDQYDLFFIDTSYGTARHSEELTRQHLKKYVEANCQESQAVPGSLHSLNGISVDLVSLTEARFACDRNFAPILEQIEAYMSGDPAGEALRQLVTMTEEFEEIGLNENEWGRQKDEVNTQLSSARQAREERLRAREAERQAREAERQAREAEQGETETDTSEEEEEEVWDPEVEDPAADVDAFRAAPMLNQVFGAGNAAVSGSRTEVTPLFSHRTPHYGSGLEADNSHHYQKASKGVVNLYLFEKCGNYQNKKDGSVLDYELEYILCGKESDRENLEGTLARLCVIRTAANCVYLFSNAAKRNEARAAAAAIGAATVTPALIPVYTTGILLAWGYIESIADLKTLTSGGKVPLLKDDASWQTGINLIHNPTAVTGAAGEAGGAQRGLNYENYLGLLLFFQGQNEKLGRLADVMEMNVRKLQGKETFSMDWCMDTFTAAMTVESSIGYSCHVQRTVTYN